MHHKHSSHHNAFRTIFPSWLQEFWQKYATPYIGHMFARRRTLVEQFLAASFQDYEVLFSLPFKQRVQGVVAISCFYGAMLCVLHFFLRAIAQTLPSELIILIYIALVLFHLIFVAIILSPSIRTYYPYILGGIAVILFFVGIIFGSTLSTQTTTIFSRSRQEARQLTHENMIPTLLCIGAIMGITYGIRFYGRVMKAIVEEKTRIEAEKAQTDGEIRTAQKIQRRLLPVIDTTSARYSVYGATVLATEIGGDYFDMVPLTDSTDTNTGTNISSVAFAVGDVSGHNISAGLLMAMTKSAFRTELKHCSYSNKLPELLQSLNRTILENSEKGMFVSFMTAIVEQSSEQTGEYVSPFTRITIANAGHIPALHWSVASKTVDEIAPKGMALGLASRGMFSAQTIEVQCGDILVLLTDGVVEAANTQHEEFGIKRVKHLLQTTLQHSPATSPQHIYNVLMQAIITFTGTDSREDDTTLLILRLC